MNAYVKKENKIGRVNDEKAGELENKQKMQDPQPRMKNETYFSLWGFDSVVLDDLLLLISLLKTNIIFFHFEFLQANLIGGKGDTFKVGPGRLRYATDLASFILCTYVLIYNIYTVFSF